MEINKNNYFSTKASMAFFGATQFKNFLKCEAGALAECKGEFVPDTTTAMLVGSYVDAYFSGEIAEFTANHPELFNKKTGELKASYQKADGIIERIDKSKLFKHFLDGEPQKIMVGELFGEPWKIKVDALHDDKIVDLKVMKDLKPVWKNGELKTFIDAWGYDLQGYIYQQIVKYNTGKQLPFYLAVATKEAHTDLAIIEIPQWRLNVARGVIEYYLPRFAAIKRGEKEPTRCEKCDYCKDTKIGDALIKHYDDLLEGGY